MVMVSQNITKLYQTISDCIKQHHVSIMYYFCIYLCGDNKKLKIKKRMDFVLNDESRVNSHGFILMNSGGNFERFRENPVMLHNHNIGELIGSWDNLRTDGSLLKAAAKFDSDDDLSKKIEGRVNRGFLKGASPGICIIDAELKTMPDGLFVPVVTKWELMEASVVSVPSNAGALKLYNKQGEAVENSDDIQLIINSKEELKISNQKLKMKEIVLTAQALTLLGLNADSDGSAISTAILALGARAEKAESELSEQKKSVAVSIVDKAIREGRLSADRKDDFVKLAMADAAQAQSIIDAIPARQTLGDRIKPGEKSVMSAGREDWDYKKWFKEDAQGLRRLKAENPDAYEQLRKTVKN